MLSIRLLRRLFAIACGIVLVTFIFLLCVVLFVDPNAYRADMSRYLSTTLGRTVQLNGKLAWNLFPGFGLTVHDVVVDNQNGYGSEPLLQVNQATLRLNIIPLLHKQLDVEELTIEGVRVQLVQNSHGNNWSDLFSKLETTQQQPTVKPETPHSAAMPFQLHVKALHFSKIELNYRDDLKHETDCISDLALKVENIHPGAASLPIEVSFTLKHEGKALWNSYHTIHTHLVFDKDQTALEHFQWQAELDSDVLPRKNMILMVHDKSPVTVSAKHIHAPDIFIRAGGIQATLNVDADKTTDWVFTGKMNGKNYSPEELMSTLAAFLPETIDLDTARNIKMSAVFNGTQNSLNVQKFDLTLAKTIVSGNMQYTKHLADKRLDYRFEVNHFKGGSLHADGVLLQGKGDFVDMTMNAAVDGVQLKALLESMHKKPYLSGALMLNAKLHTQAKDADTFKRNLNGTGDFQVNGGEINGIDFNYVVNTANAALKKTPSVGTDAKKTPISKAEGHFNIEQGILSNDDLVIDLPSLHVTGRGTINLHNDTLNYHVNAMQANEKNKDWNLPIYIEGPLASPSIQPDIAALGHMIFQNKLKDVVQQKAQELLQKNGLNLQDLLQ